MKRMATALLLALVAAGSATAATNPADGSVNTTRSQAINSAGFVTSGDAMSVATADVLSPSEAAVIGDTKVDVTVFAADDAVRAPGAAGYR
jgi:hypothetical protein